MEDKIIALAKEYDMLPKGAKVLCAVSGGRDSMCLLWVLKSLEEELGFTLAAAHFDHRLREESGADAAFVRKFCELNGIELFSGAGDVKAYAGENGLGIEEAARVLRYGFLEETAEAQGCARIATAHNADDNVETVLMNLVRGAGLRGMAGIPPRRGIIVRPMLTVSRAEVDAYVAECRLPFVEDKTNADPAYTRNRLRHQVLPILKEINPRLCDNVASTSRLLRADAGCLDAMAFGFLERNGGEIPWKEFKRLPLAVQSRIVRQTAKNLGSGLSRQQTAAVMELGPQGRIDLPNGVSARREYEKLIMEIKATELPSFTPKTLEAGKIAEIPEMGLEVSCQTAEDDGKIHSSLTTFFFKNENICGTIIIRPRAAGDCLRTRPGKGRSLKKLFIDAKIPRDRRGIIPVVADDKGVLAVFGFGQDMRCAPDGKGELIKVEIRERTETNE